MAEEVKFQKVDGKSLDIEAVDKEKLKKIFPQCFNEGKLDINKLLSLCGEYIDNDFEKYKFEWKGKSECYRIAGKRSTGTLRPCPKESVDFENTNNLYIEGDNLEVLKLLQTAYYCKVKMIYIDPPYNTGNDFVYEDDFKDPLAKYKEITSQTTKSNPETMGRYHTNWLNMMYPRLRLAANLLRDDGVIFISIDDNEVDNLKKLCNEVLGEENFVAQITLLCNPKGRSQDMYVANCHEYILSYSKTLKPKGSMSIPKSNDEISSEYVLKDERGNYRELELRNTHRDFGKFNRPNLFYPIYVNDKKQVSLTKSLEYHIEVYPIWGDGFEGCWTWGKQKVSDNINLLTAKKNGNYWKIYRKAYAFQDNEVVDKQVKSIWNDPAFYTEKGQKIINELFDTKEKIFQSPKSTETLKQMLLMAQMEKNSIVLDFFCGSATTAHAVMQLNAEDGGNRQFIMVQLPELTAENSEAFKAGYKNICEIGKERIRRAGAKIKAEHPEVDTGFKVLKLDTSNLVKWDDTPTDSEEDLFNRMNSVVKSLKNDRSELDVVFEVMLKLGIPPTYKVNEISVNGRKVYSIGDDGLVLICLDSANGGITPEDISAMCDLAPAKIVAAEEAFEDDIALSNAYYISKDKGIEIELL